ncbi:MAG: hypothetical protein JSS43_07465 [Proteobacteria bacterium]|nr:hypothetical protein [Pseudomonadota bacterium]
MKTGLVAALAAAGMNMGLTPDLPRLRAIWPTALALRSLDAVPFVIVGDSHSTFYRYAAVRENKWLLPLHVCCTAGSARGLGNPNSRSGYGTQLRGLFQFIEDKAATDRMPILIQFGQVDLEFVQPFQRVKDGAQAFDAEAFRSFAVSSVRFYIEFLCDAIPRSLRPRLTVLGVFPPALSNETLRKGYVNGHIAALDGMDEVSLKSVLAALEWPDCHLRTALHADYNA